MVYSYIRRFIVFILAFVYKRIFKFFVRKIKKTHEIDRLLNNNGTFNQIILCLMNSSFMTKENNILLQRVLFNYKQDKNIEDRLSDKEIGKFMSIVSFYCTVKKLNLETKNKLNIFFEMIKVIIIDFRLNLLNQTEYQFDDQTNQAHVDILKELWNITYNTYNIETIYHDNKTDNSSNNIQLIDDRWLWIGFQAKSPITDFRSTGLFGLNQLYNFCKYSDNFLNVYNTACDKKKWYFFAAAGINISGKIRQYLLSYPTSILMNEMLFNLFQNKTDKRIINNLFTETSEKANLLNKTVSNKIFKFLNNIYSELFTDFNNEWNKQEKFNFMNFNTNFENFIGRKFESIVKEEYDKMTKNSQFY
jgi:hypothetical protein